MQHVTWGALVCFSAARRIEELQDSLQKKDADLWAMEERYRRYVDKAHMVRMLGVPLSYSICFPSAHISFQFVYICPLRSHLSYHTISHHRCLCGAAAKGCQIHCTRRVRGSTKELGWHSTVVEFLPQIHQ